MTSFFRRFLRDEGGFAFVFFLIAMPAFMGVALLAIDIGRGNNVHYDLQRAVDSLALQAAKELNGRNDAITRATAVLTNPMAQNRPRFSDEGEAILSLENANIEFEFLRRIPPNDDEPIDAEWRQMWPAFLGRQAEFVWVRATPQSYTTIFPVSMALGRDTVQMSAEAVAGYHLEVCDFMPLYICNPYDSVDELDQALIANQRRRSLFQLRQGPSDPTQASSGQYGFLRVPGNPGASAIAEMLAADEPPACFSQQGVDMQPGQLGANASSHINVRFDIYEQAASNLRNRRGYVPARNVRKGYKAPSGNQCPQAPNPNQYTAEELREKYVKLPRDDCFYDGNCQMLGGFAGDGVWDCAWYWEQVHGNALAPEGCTPGSQDPPSRFEVYMHEITTPGLLDNSPESGEKGHPLCYNGQPIPQEARPDRRLIYAAIVQCPVDSTSDVPVEAFASFFLTEPAGFGSGSAIWAELFDVTGNDGPIDDLMREDVVLYR